MKKLNKAQLRKKADKLLQDYIRAKHKDELCWVCGERPITCGHHFFPVSNSLATRYYVPNIIPICKECHAKVHTQPHLVQPVLALKMGKGWLDDLLAVKMQGAKYTREWIEVQYMVLTELMKELK